MDSSPASFDVICEVIKVLAASGDHQTIRSLSTSCQVLTTPSQRILFKKISLDDRQNYESMNKLLIGSPHLSKYIQNLRCRFNDNSDLPPPFVPSLLKRMINIDRLHIVTHKTITWSRLDTNLKDAVLLILQSPSIRIFRMQGNISIPKLLLASMSKSLTLLDMGKASFDTTNPEIHHGCLLGLRHLHLGWGGEGARSRLQKVLELAPLLSSLEVQGLFLPSLSS